MTTIPKTAGRCEGGAITVRACANIALVKYWGKRDTRLNLPAAGSLSMTVDALTTTTTVSFGPAASDTLILDGVAADDQALGKALRVVDPIRRRAAIERPVTIESANAFPTAAGLASSASGLAALTVAACRAAGLELTAAEQSALARRGSGSACRSLFGGFVEWLAGSEADGSDSYARQLAGRQHWKLNVVVAVICSGRKAVGSSRGMQHTRSSPFHGAFVASVEEDLLAARQAISARDLFSLGRVAERSCLRMHAMMLAADPPLLYLQPQSWQIIEAVRQARQQRGLAAFFTADAGPNVKIFCLPEAVPAVRALLEQQGVQQIIVGGPGPAPQVIEP